LIPRLEAAFREVLDGKGFIRSSNYWAFQEEAAAYLGVKRTIGVANGTDALVLALDALGVGPGDEVICPAFTFYATAESVARRGATPVFADIDPVTLNLDLEDTAAKVTARTRAIIPVHLFGRLLDVRPLLGLDVPVLEDAAQAFGAPGAAQLGAISTFSFYPTKNLFCLGDGGLVATNDEELAERVKLLSFHGSRDKQDFDLVGYNSRLDELQAAFLRVFLPELDGWNEARRAAAARYAAGRAEPRLPPLRLPLARARRDPRGTVRGGHRVGDVLHDAAPPPAVAALPRLRAGLAARDGAGGSGELLAAPLARDPGRGAGARRRGRPLRGSDPRLMRRLITPHRLGQLLIDGGIVALSWWLAFELRFNGGLPRKYSELFNRTILLVVVIQLVVFIAFGFYNRWWRYTSTRDMWAIARGVVVACLVADLTVYLVAPVHGFRLPRSIAATDLLLTLAFIAGSRLLARTMVERRGLTLASGKEVVVVGAGDAGRLIVQEMQRSRMLNYTPIGFVDDDPRKRHTRIMGVRVLGSIDELPRVLREHRPDEVLIAMPSVSGEVRRRIVENAQELRIVVKTLPGLYELISGDLGLAGQIRPVQVEDVLGREQVEVDFSEVAGYLEGHTVLVTGAGGSIGSELCRQIARVRPSRLILVDNAEGPLFEIERELASERDFTAALPKLVDVKDRKAMRREVFERYQPTVVFHAAAYKHVAMLETHPLASVRNNVVGTRVLVELAAEFGVERFVFISTDKAVNPKTVMGQSKALCEWIVESFGHRRDVSTRFVAVRFGNVLNSSGSVIPIFRKQIERGGPVTVTHPDMTRYFMTIPEAVSLVVQAGAIGARRADHVHRLEARREDPRGALERRRRVGRRDDASEDHATEPAAGRSRLARRPARRAGAPRRGRRHARGRGQASQRRERAAARPAAEPLGHRQLRARDRPARRARHEPLTLPSR
jgi:FlaA1/EpsC-like NDP-sugar epimerase